MPSDAPVTTTTHTHTILPHNHLSTHVTQQIDANLMQTIPFTFQVFTVGVKKMCRSWHR